MEDLIYKVAYGRRREILVALYSEGPSTLSKLRKKLGVSSSALLFDLAALEALGLVRRDDGMVELTDAGVRAASILSSLNPLRSWTVLELLGIRPLLVPMLMSPYSRGAAALLALLWALSMYLSNTTLVGVVYMDLFINKFLSLIISYLSFIFIILFIYIFTKRKVDIFHIIIGIFPLLLYPPLAAINAGLAYMLKFVLLLFACGSSAAVASFDLGLKYEVALLIYLSIMFILPILIYLFFHVFI
ncbi:MAG: ArsR family transcriptional regulator [Thermoproteus sp.]|nr:ArsR family transcriptional regulator [Thermoproteus sp.]